MNPSQLNWEIRYRLPGKTDEQIFSSDLRGLSAKDELYIRIIQLNSICVIEAVGTSYQVGLYRNGVTRLVESKQLQILQINDKVCFRQLNNSFDNKEEGWDPQHYLKVVRTEQNANMPAIHNVSQYLLELLPEIYRSGKRYNNDFLSQFLSLIEQALLPIQWGVDNADLYFRLGTTPASIYSWLTLFMPMLSTEHGMTRLLCFVSGSNVKIETKISGSFVVTIQSEISKENARKLSRLIEAFKPIGVNYKLDYKEKNLEIVNEAQNDSAYP